MREVVGPAGPNRYPTFSSDVSQSFVAALEDLDAYGGAVLSDDPSEFEALFPRARQHGLEHRGMKALAEVEKALKKR